MPPSPAVGLQVRKLADKTEGERIRVIDQNTGQPKLVNPETPGEDHESWPLLGVQILGNTPKRCTMSQSYLVNGRAEGWIEVEGGERVFRPSGPPANPWGTPPHVFLHIDAVVIKCLEGDVRYKVIHQPDKYVQKYAGETGQPIGRTNDEDVVTDEIYTAGDTRVDHFYVLELED